MTNNGKTILIVDDAVENLSILNECLRPYYLVLAATSGGKALQIAASEPRPDLILLDVIMPGLSGRDLAQRLLDLRPALKRLFISGFTADVIAQRGILDDGVNFLSKPFGRDVLARKVREVLG